MAQAQYNKEKVVAVAEARLEEILEKIQQRKNEKQEQIKKVIAQEMLPKWYRPWALSREKVEETYRWLLQENLSGWDFTLYTLNRRQTKALSIYTLAKNADSETVTLNEEEAEFIFN
jgi:hypothetical protein